MKSVIKKVLFCIVLLAPISVCPGVDMGAVNKSSKGGIVLIRHGEGEHNVAHIYNSHPDNPGYRSVKLTERGREQVRKTSERIIERGINGDNVCKVIVSPLPRAIETADIVMGKLQIARFLRETDPRAIEQNAGERDGQDYRQYQEADIWFPEHPASYGGETRSEIRDRMASLIQSIADDPNCDLGRQYVIVVSHASPLLLAQEFLGMGDERLETAGYRIAPYLQIEKVMGRNDSSHKNVL